ncbi:hypothetical protein H4R33_001983 [Dimargaris cristalligena]|nr:hypothetical protein H4R33_001983 [Dimargaris cristalligena]
MSAPFSSDPSSFLSQDMEEDAASPGPPLYDPPLSAAADTASIPATLPYPAASVATESLPAGATPPPMAALQLGTLAPMATSSEGEYMDASGPSTPQISIHLTATPETAAQVYSPTPEAHPPSSPLPGSRADRLRGGHGPSGSAIPSSPLSAVFSAGSYSHPVTRYLVIEDGSLPENIRAGVLELVPHLIPRHIVLDSALEATLASAGAPNTLIYRVSFEHSPLMIESRHLQVGYFPASNEPDTGGHILVRYHRTIEAFRALGRIVTAFDHMTPDSEPAELFSFSEEAQLETLGTMIDCSRNGVLIVDRVHELLRYCSLLGINMVQLYTEDTYKVPDEPFFGYLRGPYTYHELSDIDNYAFNLGVEVIPCIQTLGHLGQILQWPRFAHVRDTSEVLLSKFDETYELIEKMVRSVTAPFRSKRIHIGMDEAHGVGEGRFREFYGHEEGTKIFVDHLKRVTDICRTMDLKPMIWSDMLFCLAAKNNALHAYYDQNNTAASEHVIDCLPPDLELVFWNYYHTDPEIYAKKLQQHRELGCANPWMAGGAWTWNRLWCSLPFTLESNQASLTVSKRANGGVDHYMLTIWGDEGNECDFFSALPALVFVAHHGYTPAERIDHSFMTHSFASICGGHFDDWVHASKLDEAPPPIHNPSGAPGPDARMLLPPNLSKWLLWEDPFLSFMSPQYTGFDLEDHYQKLSSHLFRAAGQRQRYPLNLRLQLPARLAQVLAHKCHLRERMVYAYRCGNLYQLYELVSTRLEPLIRHTRMLWQYHRALWMYMYKPYGWEVVELRYGGLLTRMQTMRDRIMRYVECQSSKIAGNQQQQQQQQQSQHNGNGSMSVEVGGTGSANESPNALKVNGAMRSDTTMERDEQSANVPSGSGDPPLNGKGKVQGIHGSAASTGKPHLSSPPPLGAPRSTWIGTEAVSRDNHPLAFGLNDPHNLAASGFPLPYADSIPEFEEDLQTVYEHAGTMLLLDYGRVTTPSRLG